MKRKGSRVAFSSKALIFSLVLQAMSLGMAYAATDLNGPKLLQISAPEYPAVARRFSIQGTVVVELLVDTDGRVRETKIVESPADVLSEAVRRATPSWRFSKPDQPKLVRIDVPFRLADSEDEAYDLALRPLVSMPREKNELGKRAMDGSADVRIFVGPGDQSDDFYIAKISSPGFRRTIEEIIKLLRFSGTPSNGKVGSINILRIRVDDSSPIEIQQLPGK